MKKVRVWLMGGFGNILFHLFVAHLLKKKGYDISVCTLLTHKNIFTNILGWTIHDRFYHGLMSDFTIKKGSVFPLLYQVISRYLKVGRGYSFFYKNTDCLMNTPSSNIFGYFQHKYFLENNRGELIIFSQIIAKKIEKLVKRKITKKNQVCIHIRLGDSIWAKNNIDYYYKAIETIPNDVDITVITDSLVDAKKLFSGFNVKFLSHNNALDDFHMLASSNTIICAPSTFSWWAAHCSLNAEAIVFPKVLYDKLGFYADKSKLILI